MAACVCVYVGAPSVLWIYMCAWCSALSVVCVCLCVCCGLALGGGVGGRLSDTHAVFGSIADTGLGGGKRHLHVGGLSLGCLLRSLTLLIEYGQCGV